MKRWIANYPGIREVRRTRSGVVIGRILYGIPFAVLLLAFPSTWVHAQKRECVTVHYRVPRVPLKQVISEMVGEESGFSYAMQAVGSIVFARITHRSRALSDLSRTTISLWTRAANNGMKLEFSQDEVEVESGGKKYWFPIFKQYIGDILHRTREGEGIYLYVWSLGIRENTPVFYIVNYGTIDEWGSHDDVLEDALESAVSLVDSDESLAIVAEMERRWSGEAWWQEAHTILAVNFIKGIAHLARGRTIIADPYLQIVREYIAQNLEDDFAQTMLAAMTRASFNAGIRSQACNYAVSLESADDDIEQKFCDVCLRGVLHGTELGKKLDDVMTAGGFSESEAVDRGPYHATCAVNGMQVLLHADSSSGVVAEKRVLFRSANEDAMDWIESAFEDAIDDFEDKLEELAEESGQGDRMQPTRVEMTRRETGEGELLEVVFH